VFLQTTGSHPFYTSQPSVQTTASCSRVHIIGFVILSLFVNLHALKKASLCPWQAARKLHGGPFMSSHMFHGGPASLSLSFSIFVCTSQAAPWRKSWSQRSGQDAEVGHICISLSVDLRSEQVLKVQLHLGRPLPRSTTSTSPQRRLEGLLGTASLCDVHPSSPLQWSGDAPCTWASFFGRLEQRQPHDATGAHPPSAKPLLLI
jgi:hypothetical protein